MLDPAPPRSIDIGPAVGPAAAANSVGAGDSTGGRESLGHLFHRAVEDGREFVTAELDVVKAKASVKLAAVRGAAIPLAVAVVLALSSVTALLVGLILTVATLVGPGWATLIVIGVTLAIAGVLMMIALRRWHAGTAA